MVLRSGFYLTDILYYFLLKYGISNPNILWLYVKIMSLMIKTLQVTLRLHTGYFIFQPSYP